MMEGSENTMNEINPNEVLRLPYDMVRSIAYHEALEPYVQKFRETIWNGGFRESQAATRKRYHSCVLANGFDVRSGSLAGRLMMTIADGDKDITIIGAEDEPDRDIGIQSMGCTVFEARELLEAAVAHWPFEIVPSDTVTIG